ncbi:MAG: hypothetical protein ACP6IY_19600 [Promethearchaeia archaeon]
MGFIIRFDDDEDLRNERREKLRRKAIVIGAIIAVITSFSVLIYIYTPEISQDQGGNESKAVGIENAYFDLVIPDYCRNFSILSISTDHPDAIKNVTFYANNSFLNHKLLTSKRFSLTPYAIYLFNESFKPKNGIYAINSTGNCSELNVFFDRYNYTFKDYYSAQLILNISGLKGVNVYYSIGNSFSNVIYKSGMASKNNSVIADIPAGILPLDCLSLKFWSNISAPYKVNFSIYLSITPNYNSNMLVFRIYNFTGSGKYNIRADIELNQKLIIDGEQREYINLSGSIICDKIAPVLNISLNSNNITYSMFDNQEVYLRHAICYFNNGSKMIINLTNNQGILNFNDTVKGLFFIADAAGNTIIKPFYYKPISTNDNTSTASENDLTENDKNEEDKGCGSCNNDVLSLPLIIGLITILSFLSIVIPLNKIRRDKKLRKDITVEIKKSNNPRSINKSIIIKTIVLDLGLATLQTGIMGVLIYVIERFGNYYLVVHSYNVNFLNASEVGIAFFIIYLLSDLFGEFLRQLFKIWHLYLSPLILALLTAAIQLGTLSLLLFIAKYLGILDLWIIDASGKNVSIGIFYGFFAIIVIIAELFVIPIRRGLGLGVISFYTKNKYHGGAIRD